MTFIERAIQIYLMTLHDNVMLFTKFSSYMSKELFEIWLHHFEAAIDENYQGINCERMKNQAHNLSTIMQIKIAKEKEGKF